MSLAPTVTAPPSAPLVLLVEDESEIREPMRILLEEEGYAVLTAKEGGEALEHLRRGERPQLVLLDLMMRGMNGWQFLDQLKADPVLRSTPVVILSAFAPPIGIRYLRKPVGLDELLSVVEEYCQTAR